MTIERARAINEWLDIHCPKCANNNDRGTDFVIVKWSVKFKRILVLLAYITKKRTILSRQESEDKVGDTDGKDADNG